jgi:hypothetical protein
MFAAVNQIRYKAKNFRRRKGPEGIQQTIATAGFRISKGKNDGRF